MSTPLKIMAFTTDPYENIFGYTLIFMQLMDYLDRHHEAVVVQLISNDGFCSRVVHNPHFKTVPLDPHASLITKTRKLALAFLKLGLKSSANTIIITNSEIPELISAWMLKYTRRRTFCFVHDYGDNFRKNATAYHRIRNFLLARIKNIIVLNSDHKRALQQDIKGINCFVIPNPVFVEDKS